jgi:hypothetical protein
MQDVHVKVNQDCHGKSSIQQEEEDTKGPYKKM